MGRKAPVRGKKRELADTGNRALADTGNRAQADTADRSQADKQDRAQADTADRSQADKQDRAQADTADRSQADKQDRAQADTDIQAPAGKRSGVSTQRLGASTQQPGASTPPGEDTANIDRKGIWEACYESGVVIGYFEGTPRQIATFIINTVEDGSFIRKLNFLQIPIRRIPEKLIKQTCCGRNYSKNDRFCSRCGKSLEMNKKLTSKIRLEVNC